MITAPGSTADRFRGCLLGAAVGDALGAPVEFSNRNAIEAEFGPEGIAAYPGPVGLVTDDTQMALYTAAACLQWWDHPEHGRGRTLDLLLALCWSAYQEWSDAQDGSQRDHWPAKFPRVSAAVRRQGARYPGGTCTGACCGSRPGTALEPLNNSKGAGGIMRSAPLGLLGRDGADPFVAGCHAAALTHGHPLGYYPAGALAAIVDQLVGRASIPEAVDRALVRLYPAAQGAPDVLGLIAMVREGIDRALADGLAWNPEELGRGWTADEALAIGVAALVGARGDVGAGIRWAVNHGGDSDTTGCVAGALLGAAHGAHAIPDALIYALEDRDLVIEIADALHDAATGGPVRTF